MQFRNFPFLHVHFSSPVDWGTKAFIVRPVHCAWCPPSKEAACVALDCGRPALEDGRPMLEGGPVPPKRESAVVGREP